MNTNQKIDSNNKMSEGISKLMVISESYPEFKSNENFIALSNQLMKIEEKYLKHCIQHMMNIKIHTLIFILQL